MSSHSSLSRKDFLVLTVSLVGTSALAVAGCGDDGGGGGGGGGAGTGGGGTGGGTPLAGSGGTPAAGTSSGGAGSGGTPGGGAGSGGTPGGGAGSGGGGASGAGSGGGGASGASGSGGKAGSGGGGTGGTSGGGSGGGGTGGGGSGGGGSCSGMVVFQQTAGPGNHDHVMNGAVGSRGTIQLMNGNFGAAEVNAGQPMATMLTIRGTGDDAHEHTLMLTQQDIQTLRSGGMVTGKVSMGGGHMHTYTISCGTV